MLAAAPGQCGALEEADRAGLLRALWSGAQGTPVADNTLCPRPVAPAPIAHICGTGHRPWGWAAATCCLAEVTGPWAGHVWDEQASLLELRAGFWGDRYLQFAPFLTPASLKGYGLMPSSSVIGWLCLTHEGSGSAAECMEGAQYPLEGICSWFQ